MSARRPAEVFPPGEFLREELEERGWTQLDLAEVMGRPAVLVNGIISGKRGITPETAQGLAAALGTSPELWLRLEAAYRLWREGAEGETSVVARRARVYRRAPVREMQKRGWIERSTSPEILEERVVRFLGIKSLDEQCNLAVAAKKSTPLAVVLNPLQEAWLARARHLAVSDPVAPCSRAKLKDAVERLKGLMSSEQDVREVPRVLAEAGVRFVIVQPLPGSKIDGATFLLDENPVIALSLRFDRVDNFWFVLMHEIAHVLHGDAATVETELLEHAEDDVAVTEKRANAFASEHLVPRRDLERFIREVRPAYSNDRIREFAARIRVHPALVVGQLQHRKEISWSAFRRLMVPIRACLVPAAITDGWGFSPQLQG